MSKPEVKAVKRLLESALKGLQEGGSYGEAVSLIIDGSGTFESGEFESPVVVILPGGLKADLQDTDPAGVGDALRQVMLNSPVSGSERKDSHPGLERFTIGAAPQTSAPKACFMEPGRPCVNSGACEMRGF